MTTTIWNDTHPELPTMLEGPGECDGCGRKVGRLFELHLPVGDGLERQTVNACAECAHVPDEALEHEPGCCLDHDPGDGECATAEEMRDEMLLQRHERELDDAGRGWRR